MRRAIVVFSDETTLPVLRWFLKKRFRHCHVVVQIGAPDDGVLYIDGCSTGLACQHVMTTLDAAKQGYLDNGSIVFEARINEDTKWGYTFTPFSCVEVVKRAIGLKTRTLTPYGLFKVLIKKKLGDVYDEQQSPATA